MLPYAIKQYDIWKKTMTKKIYYIAVTNDRFEFPVFEAQTMTELSKKANVRLETISRHISKKKKPNKLSKFKFYKIEEEENEN